MQSIMNNIANPENPIIPTIVPCAGIAEVSIDKKNYVVNSREFNTIIHNEYNITYDKRIALLIIKSSSYVIYFAGIL